MTNTALTDRIYTVYYFFQAGRIIMEKVKKKLAFGCMRLPMLGDKVDEEQFKQMADEFIAAGFNYFDTAHGYIGGLSEKAIRTCLTSRHPRESYILTDKLTDCYFENQEGIRPFFESQLKLCGVDYFDYYLMHAMGAGNYPKYKSCKAYETCLELKAEGKIKHFGLSFHDRADVLEQILTDCPQVEVVQIQFNYLDYDDPEVQSRKCYEVCRKFGKKILIMEPVKGGNLVNIPDDALRVLSGLNGGSPASYAIRFAAGFEGVLCVLSGMSSIEQLRDNIGYMQDFKPLNDGELDAIENVRNILKGKHTIQCTACRYCIEGCPEHISIPDLFSCMNAKVLTGDRNPDFDYNEVYTKNNGKASDCIKCGKCEKTCPQHLPIRKLLEDVAATFERNE